MAYPAKYCARIHDRWAWSLAICGATDKEIAFAFEVTEKTINRWKYKLDDSGKPILDKSGKKVLSSFGTALQTGKETADADVEYSLYRRATGFKATDVERIIETNPDNGVQTVARTRIIEKEIQPDTMAIMYWLNNRSRRNGKWSQRQVITYDGTVDFGAQMKSIADLINDPSEDRNLPE